MPLARVRIRLYGTQAQLTSARTQIVSQYPQANRIYDRADGTISPAYQGTYALTMDCRLKQVADGTALRDKLRNIVTTLRASGVTGRITYHLCTHLDANVVTCAPEVVVV